MNCNYREVNCHSSCKLYKEYRSKIDAVNKLRRLETEFYSYSFDRKLAMGVARDI